MLDPDPYQMNTYGSETQPSFHVANMFYTFVYTYRSKYQVLKIKYQAKNTKYIFQFFRLVYPIHYARVVIAAGAQSGKRRLYKPIF
jgi:hypothetical protein